MTHVKTFGVAGLAAAAGLAGAVLLAPAAQALPLAPLPGGALIETVAGGCGPGFHPNPWGVCRPNWGPRPYWRRPVYGPYAYGPPRPFYGRPAYYGPRPFY